MVLAIRGPESSLDQSFVGRRGSRLPQRPSVGARKIPPVQGPRLHMDVKLGRLREDSRGARWRLGSAGRGVNSGCDSGLTPFIFFFVLLSKVSTLRKLCCCCAYSWSTSALLLEYECSAVTCTLEMVVCFNPPCSCIHPPSPYFIQRLASKQID
jgi:hypothetical protein